MILCTNGGEPGDQDITEAAGLAAYYSQAKDSANVPVDCTQVKYVKKPVGARPGMVIYTTYRTVNVTPAEDLVRRLQTENNRKKEHRKVLFFVEWLRLCEARGRCCPPCPGTAA